MPEPSEVCVNVLVLDEARSARRVLRHILAGIEGTSIVEATTPAEAKTALEGQPVDVVIADIRLGTSLTDRRGLEFIRWMRDGGLEAPVVIVTSATDVGDIRETMRLGIEDYVLKDELSAQVIVPIMRRLQNRLGLHSTGAPARITQSSIRRGANAIAGRSKAIERVRRLIARVAPAEAPILIRGETGSGKELVARAVHEMSGRSGERFLAVNCSALPGTLVESMIFGHERGAFTGAARRVRGHLELAGGGTLLLDEIAEMAGELQAKLLRVLEDRRFQPLGSEEEIPLKARVLAATHVDLERRIAEGRFREDLYYRLNVVTIEVPPLRDRAEDLPDLLSAFLADNARRLRVTDDAIRWLQSRPWPGNVRELKNIVERVSLLSESDDVDIGVLRDIVGDSADQTALEVGRMARSILALPARLGSKIDVIERAVLHQAIDACGGNKSAAARLVGLDRKALERRWERFSLEAPVAAYDEDD